MTAWQDFWDNPGPRRIQPQRPVCDHDRIPGVLITRRGQRRGIAYCLKCGHHDFVAHESLPGPVWTLPAFIDNSLKCCGGRGCPQCSHLCARCGSYEDIETHHWAPRHLFDDPDDWPTAELCRGCHTLWHRTVTPNMGGRTA